MKYLLVIAVVLVAFWVWRNDRRRDQAEQQPRRPPPSSPPTPPVPMVACRHCGTHLPQTEAIQGAHGWYCCAGHRRLEDPPA